MSTATAKRPKKATTKKPAAKTPKAAKKAATAKTPKAAKPEGKAESNGRGKQWEGYQSWELIRGLKHEGVEIDGVKTILSGIGLELTPGRVGTVFRRRADAGAVSGKQPKKISPEHLAELRKKFAEQFATK